MIQRHAPRRPAGRLGAFALAGLALLALLAGSCSKKTTRPVVPGEPGLGTAIIDTSLVSVGSELAWSGATNEICYVENFSFDVDAVGATNHVRRRIDDQGTDYTLSSNGHDLFYRLLDFAQLPLIRRDLTSFQRDTIALHVSDFLLTPDDSLVAYTVDDDVAPDSLFVLRIATGEKTLVAYGLP